MPSTMTAHPLMKDFHGRPPRRASCSILRSMLEARGVCSCITASFWSLGPPSERPLVWSRLERSHNETALLASWCRGVKVSRRSNTSDTPASSSRTASPRKRPFGVSLVTLLDFTNCPRSSSAGRCCSVPGEKGSSRVKTSIHGCASGTAVLSVVPSHNYFSLRRRLADEMWLLGKELVDDANHTADVVIRYWHVLHYRLYG